MTYRTEYGEPFATRCAGCEEELPKDWCGGEGVHALYGHGEGPVLCLACYRRALTWAAKRALSEERNPAAVMAKSLGF